MIPVLTTQMVTVDERRGERRDTLDHRWAEFLIACGLVPIAVPNNPTAAGHLLITVPTAGVLLTGGNDLTAYGGTAPERDATERLLLTSALRQHRSVLGVCRGMQMLQHHFGVSLARVSQHAGVDHDIDVQGTPRRVNSYHRWAACDSAEPLDVWARAADGVVESVGSHELRVAGIMWHPERVTVPDPHDIALFCDLFASAPCAR
ncbi:gamma-glutamyl-gamma-aminobutyrate hydrolase family protein [Nocardia sp. NPDC049737]|uniref:gamma-glutamyl-gamma-aminobutyrate hydrolase family protein n=1 Tax=Nocardia sp. NPDC049737 TaxID=3154358 RepID=UPI0034246AC5